MNRITLNKGQFYKLKQYKNDREYVIICPSKKVILKGDYWYYYIPSLFTVTGYGKRKKLHPYSYNKHEKSKLVKCGWVCNVTVWRGNYNTIKPLTIKDCTQLNLLLRERNFVFNKKIIKLIKLI